MNKTTEALKLVAVVLEDIIRVYKFETGTPVTTLAAIREVLAKPEITTPDVCGEVCARAKLCYGCGKALDEANAKLADHSGDSNEMIMDWSKVKPEAIKSDPMYQMGYAAAKAEPVKQEPVAWDLAEKVRRDLDRQSCPGVYMDIAVESIVKNYVAPVSAKREWVELTDYEIVMLYAESPMCDSEMIAFARDVIAAFKEKNT